LTANNIGNLHGVRRSDAEGLGVTVGVGEFCGDRFVLFSFFGTGTDGGTLR
jgi:hypothetical protein